MGLGLAAAHAWLLADLALYGAIRLAHPIRGIRVDRTRVFRRELLPELSRPSDPPALRIRWQEWMRGWRPERNLVCFQDAKLSCRPDFASKAPWDSSRGAFCVSRTIFSSCRKWYTHIPRLQV